MSNYFGQFLGSMVRQTGRNVANDMYNRRVFYGEATTNKPDLYESKIKNGLCLICDGIKTVPVGVWFTVLLFSWFPLLFVYTLYQGIKRISFRTFTVYCNDRMPIYVRDRRYAAGIRLEGVQPCKNYATYKTENFSKIAEILIEFEEVDTEKTLHYFKMRTFTDGILYILFSIPSLIIFFRFVLTKC